VTPRCAPRQTQSLNAAHRRFALPVSRSKHNVVGTGGPLSMHQGRRCMGKLTVS
jgi:hypothetical protein